MTYRYVERAGARIAYRVSGSGAALVLLKNHRRPLHYAISAYLAERLRVFQVHPVGFGASDRPDGYDFGSIGEQVIAVLDREGVERFGVWGFSQTACMAAMVARSTERASALVMGGVPPIGILTDGEMRRLEREPRLPRPALEFWRAYRSYDWHHELRCYPGRRVAYMGTADPAIRRFRRLRTVLEGIGMTYLEFEGLTHSTCGLGDASSDGRRVAHTVCACLGKC
ncbi:alpha/beta hydrolase [Kribbella karoonensis]|uniref:Alpha/beta hydrolase family protein n=1 Tax=Kribbella karoonensis TaxID=324851 RepID=A0ABN2DQF8_9ACTN